MMKIYEFRILAGAFVVVIISISIFLYALIWLSNGFNVEERLSRLSQDFHEEIKQEIKHEALLQHQFTKQSIDQLKGSIMPSSFKGDR